MILLMLSALATATDTESNLEVFVTLSSGSGSCGITNFESALAVSRWYTHWDPIEELTIKIVDSDGWKVTPAIENGYQVIEVAEGDTVWVDVLDAWRSSSDALSWFDTEVISDYGSRTLRTYVGGGMSSEVAVWDREELDEEDLFDGLFYGQVKASCASRAPDHFMEVEVGTFNSYLYTFSSSGTATSETITGTTAIGVIPCDDKIHTFTVSGYMLDAWGGDELWVTLNEKNKVGDRFSCDGQRVTIPGYGAWSEVVESLEKWAETHPEYEYELGKLKEQEARKEEADSEDK